MTTTPPTPAPTLDELLTEEAARPAEDSGAVEQCVRDTERREAIVYEVLDGDHEADAFNLAVLVVRALDDAERPEGPEVSERLAASRIFNPEATEYEVGWRAGWDKAIARLAARAVLADTTEGPE